MHPALFQKWKICPALLPPSVGRKNWIPVENCKILLEKYASEKIPALKNNRFCSKTPFCFYTDKHLIKEVNNFWYSDHDCTPTAAHSSEKFNAKMFLNNYCKTVPPSVKTFNFTTNCHFVSSWKSIDWKSWCIFDGAIRIVHQFLQNYIRNSTEGFS